jgi:outer membrane protein
MKKGILGLVFTLVLFSCQKETKVKEFKTAYIDTVKLLTEYTEAKDLEAKYKTKSEAEGRTLELEINKFKADAANFQKNAQANGQMWAQQNGAALQKRQEQLQYAQQDLADKLQRDMAVERDTMVSQMKKAIKEYGKQKGYAYVFGSGEPATVLYAEDQYDITKDVIKLLNDKYKGAPAEAPKKEEKKK